MCASHGVRNVSVREDFAYVLIEWFPSEKSINVTIMKKFIEYTLGNVYSHLFWDIAVRSKVIIMPYTAGWTKRIEPVSYSAVFSEEINLFQAF